MLGTDVGLEKYILATAAAAKLLQSCPTLCNPIDGSPPGFPVPGILQARTLEWVASSFSNAWKWKVKVKLLSRARFLATPWTAAYQAPLSMGFSRQKYWSRVPLPSPGHCWGHLYQMAISEKEAKSTVQPYSKSVSWRVARSELSKVFRKCVMCVIPPSSVCTECILSVNLEFVWIATRWRGKTANGVLPARLFLGWDAWGVKYMNQGTWCLHRSFLEKPSMMLKSVHFVRVVGQIVLVHTGSLNSLQSQSQRKT